MTIEDETGTANLVLWKDRITVQQAIVVRFVQPLLSHLSEESGREITISSRDLY